MTTDPQPSRANSFMKCIAGGALVAALLYIIVIVSWRIPW